MQLRWDVAMEIPSGSHLFAVVYLSFDLRVSTSSPTDAERRVSEDSTKWQTINRNDQHRRIMHHPSQGRGSIVRLARLA